MNDAAEKNGTARRSLRGYRGRSRASGNRFRDHLRASAPERDACSSHDDPSERKHVDAFVSSEPPNVFLGSGARLDRISFWANYRASVVTVRIYDTHFYPLMV